MGASLAVASLGLIGTLLASPTLGAAAAGPPAVGWTTTRVLHVFGRPVSICSPPRCRVQVWEYINKNRMGGMTVMFRHDRVTAVALLAEPHRVP